MALFATSAIAAPGAAFAGNLPALPVVSEPPVVSELPLEERTMEEKRTAAAPCYFVEFYANALPECAFAAAGGPVNPGEVTAKAHVFSPTDKTCHNTGTVDDGVHVAQPANSLFFVTYGTVPSGCSIVTYPKQNCVGLNPKTFNINSNNLKCNNNPLFFSYKMVCT